MNRRLMMKRTAKSAAALVMARVACAPAMVLGQQNQGPGQILGQALGQAVDQTLGQVLGRVYDPRRYGAQGDGVTTDTRAIQQAIDACTQSGGGTVLVGPGTYVTGTITLKSNVTFQLQAGATILGSPNIADYVLPPEGVAALKGQQGQHLIFALNAQNVTLLGPGVIDGNGKSYFVPSGRQPPKPGEEYSDMASFYMKRTTPISPMVELANITNLRVENITLQNAVGWTLHPVGCMGVVIRRVTVRNPLTSSNTDGIDPSSCQNVLITDCDIITGDDAICVKSLNPYGGNRIAQNITVTNCKISTCANGLKVGIEGPSAFSNITFRNCQLYSGNGPYAERMSAGIDVNMFDGSTIDGVTFDGITMTNVRTPIFIRLQTSGGILKLHNTQGTAFKGVIQNVDITNVRATGAILTSSITGLVGLPVRNVNLSNVDIATVEPGQLAWTQPVVQENEAKYPGPPMFGRLPSYGFYIRHVQGLSMQNVTVNSQVGDPRPMMSCEDVQQMTLQHVGGTPSDPSQAFLDLKDAQGVTIQGSQAPAGNGVFVKVSGANSHNVQLQGNDLSRIKSPIMKTLETPPDAVGQVN